MTASTAAALKAWQAARVEYERDKDRGATWGLECARTVDLALVRLERAVAVELDEARCFTSDRMIRIAVEHLIGERVVWLAEGGD